MYNSLNVINLTCSHNLCYMGHTTRRLKIRILEHLSRIRNGVIEDLLVFHFLEEKLPLESLKFLRDSCQLRKSDISETKTYKEKPSTHLTWTYVTPRGLNQALDFSSFNSQLLVIKYSQGH
uniref:Uncharacterized protein n=1 Tax=Sphaerodactylus townsendi TaxID=933632 RepID=A0ACB8ELH1_9SAUR